MFKIAAHLVEIKKSNIVQNCYKFGRTRGKKSNIVQSCCKFGRIVQNCCKFGRNWKKNQILDKVAANLVENKEIRYCSKLLQIW